MLNEEQFMKLFEGVMDNKKNTELLIRIDENTKSHTKELVAHTQDDIAKFALAKQSMDALHSRLDKVKAELATEQNQVKKDFDKATAFQNKLLGAIILAVFVVPIIINIWLRKP